MATVSTKSALVGWHELIAPDVAQAQAFYTSLFGWTVNVWKPGEADYPMIHVDGRDHGGFMQLDRPPHWLVYVEVDDVDAVAVRAERLGGRLFVEPEEIEGVGRYAVLADPQGAVLAAITPAEPQPRPRGVFVWDELSTTDVEAAKRFYGEVFGWSVAEAMPAYWIFRSGEIDVAGLMAKPAEAPVPAWLTYVKVKDADEVVGRAAGLGGRVVHPPMQVKGVGRWAVLADPVGAVFGVLGPERQGGRGVPGGR